MMTPCDSEKMLNFTDYMMLSRNQDFLAAIPPNLIYGEPSAGIRSPTLDR